MSLVFYQNQFKQNKAFVSNNVGVTGDRAALAVACAGFR